MEAELGLLNQVGYHGFLHLIIVSVFTDPNFQIQLENILKLKRKVYHVWSILTEKVFVLSNQG